MKLSSMIPATFKFIKKNWLAFLLLFVVVFISISWYKDHADLLAMHEISQETHRLEIDSITESHTRENEEQQKLLDEYLSQMETMEKEYEKELRRLYHRRDASFAKNFKLFQNNKEELASLR